MTIHRFAGVYARMKNEQLARWRQDTPGLQRLDALGTVDAPSSNTPSLVHFNNAGSSLMTLRAIQGVQEYQELEQSIGGYEAADEMTLKLNTFYQNAAKLIGALPSEIAFKESATDAGQAILLSLPLKAGDRVIVHGAEYVSNLMALDWLRDRVGIQIDCAASLSTGEIDLEDLKTKITPRTRVICLTHVATFEGTVQPAEAVGKIASEYGLFYLLDACQSIGQMHLDVSTIGCDALIGTGRKYLRGPRGTGFLYVKSTSMVDLKPLSDLRGGTLSARGIVYADGARRFERFEYSRAGQYGLSQAIGYAISVGLQNIQKRTHDLAASLREILSDVSDVDVHERGGTRSGIVTFSGAFNPASAAIELRTKSINVSVTQPPYLPSRIRASAHYFNNDDDIARLVQGVAGISN